MHCELMRVLATDFSTVERFLLCKPHETLGIGLQLSHCSLYFAINKEATLRNKEERGEVSQGC